MGKILLILIVFIVNFSFSQEKLIFNQIVEAETKAASKRIVHKANINTSNYDISYHKLEFTVDPAVKFIDGIVESQFDMDNMQINSILPSYDFIDKKRLLYDNCKS